MCVCQPQLELHTHRITVFVNPFFFLLCFLHFCFVWGCSKGTICESNSQREEKKKKNNTKPVIMHGCCHVIFGMVSQNFFLPPNTASSSSIVVVVAVSCTYPSYLHPTNLWKWDRPQRVWMSKRHFLTWVIFPYAGSQGSESSIKYSYRWRFCQPYSSRLSNSQHLLLLLIIIISPKMTELRLESAPGLEGFRSPKWAQMKAELSFIHV